MHGETVKFIFSMIAKLMGISDFTYGTHGNNTDTWTVLI